ncbi:MAG: dihydroneopterin aldolase family protein [Halanaeroarchaeum sp.]
MPSEEAAAAFEAGIKFGALYHQFAGTPVSPASAKSLETAIEESIENQPYASEVKVDIDRDRIAADSRDHGYTELTGAYMNVQIAVDYEGTRASAEMSMVDGYPLMQLTDVDSS